MRTRLVAAIGVFLLLGACGSSAQETAGTAISTAQLVDRIQGDSSPVVLDVRTREEFAKGHIPGAINIPHDELPARIGELTVAKSEELIVHCKSGRRAQVAEKALRESGYTNVRDLTGHWLEWEAKDLPTE